MCLYPKLIKNRKYTANKKNGGNIPAINDARVTWVPIGCQNCIECRKQKARGWQIRMQEEIKHRKDGKMITLTFSNQSILKIMKEIKGLSGYELDNQIATYAMRHFLERWRRKYGKSLRHWFVTELGHNGTENIHLHGIIWTDKTMDEIKERWGYGFVWTGKKENGRTINYVNQRTVNYTIKYVTKIDEKHKTYKSIILTSPGIGNKYTETLSCRLNKFKERETLETYRTNTGHKISLAIYWRNKIYTDEQREKLWLYRMDKEERWVMGIKVSIKDGYGLYDQLLKTAREKNKQFGYGNDEKNQERIEYERARRTIMQQTRIKKAYNKKVENRGNPRGVTSIAET